MSNIELNLNWKNLKKKKEKENKKIDKIENRINCSLDIYHNKMTRKFINTREQIIPEKMKKLQKCKTEAEKIVIKKEISALEKEEIDYYLKTTQFILEYEKYLKTQDESCYKINQDKLEDITCDYFKAIDVYYPKKLEYVDVYSCKLCGGEMEEIETSQFSCLNCGNSKNELGNITMSYKESIEHEYVYDFSYKRITHFQEWLNNVQAKENTEIPEEIISKIILELKKERIVDLSILKIADIRKYLKILKFNKYYEHSSIILNRINGVPPLNINSEIEKQLKIMFEKIQAPFETHKPKDRKNFLSYAYVLRKFFELIDRKEFLIYFPLLKSREKVFTHDYVWKDICKELGWNYIPSI